MKKCWLVNQDRDAIYERTGTLFTKVNEQDGVFFGINLYQCSAESEKQFLGTFDTSALIIAEINAITSTELEVYPISGYSDYDGFHDFKELFTDEDMKILEGWANI